MTDKQNKVTKKINNIGKTGSTLNLGTKKNDECYTSMQDILNELSYWADLGKFKGKNIICPCDWDITDNENIYGITIIYKDEGVEVIGNNVYKAVKEVTLDLWSNDDTPTVTKIELKEEEIEDFLREKLTCNFIRTLTQNARAWGIKSITASGYNPATGKGTPFQDVDYSKYDICITNPPFSLYPLFMKTIVGHIDFVVLAPFMNRANPSIGLPLMLKQAYIGTSGNSNCGYVVLSFNNPTIENKFNTKKVACDWITSFSEAQDERNLKVNNSGVKYETYKDEYVKMNRMQMKDGTYPIKIPADSVPEDYDGWMFGAINLMTKISHTEYEWYGTHFIGYYNKTNPSANPFMKKANDIMLIDENGKVSFAGIVFRKKRIK